MYEFPDGPKQQKRDSILKQLTAEENVSAVSRDVKPDPNAPYSSLAFNKWLNDYDTLREV